MRLLTVVVAIVFLSSVAKAVSQNTCSKVIASAHPDYPPYHWQEGDKIVGASVDLNEMIFEELGVQFTAVFAGPWKRVLKSAEYNEIDFVMSLKRTSERETYLEFTTTPAFENPFAIFTLENRTFPFETWSDLSAKRGSKNAGDRYGEPLDSFVLQILALSDDFTLSDNVNRLVLGRVDYIIHGRYVGLAQFGALSRSMAGKLEIVPLDKNIMEGYVHSAFTLGSNCRHLLPQVSRKYLEYLADGTADALLRQNIERWIDANQDSSAVKDIYHRQN
ncbi:transporter substrate-binding domain-containing protein [Roseibium denhamense]|uniref:Amino acid ABC transporter substrate-binding protein, PAAT family n=1 Tax=Roseibium denhamense TaxID=76305 RepID=A0ABY1P412_9HYPH|nr:transporter substrate-binding domain-containing protein [Roseibium denhamense]MTI07753.1 transporter substrate-binding domain-containing protein [Roseibium denhamense]SMP25189.1 amino acid ABC transporter substrate-binding protein, PAAT family [Roseibium denhamense]